MAYLLQRRCSGLSRRKSKKGRPEKRVGTAGQVQWGKQAYLKIPAGTEGRFERAYEEEEEAGETKPKGTRVLGGKNSGLAKKSGAGSGLGRESEEVSDRTRGGREEVKGKDASEKGEKLQN